MANSALLLSPRKLWKPASELQQIREESRFSPLALPQLHSLLPNGFARGSIVELYGSRSAGRTSLALYILAQATKRGEICAIVDTHDNFHPASAHAAGVRLERLLWVRCRGNVEHAIRAADLLLHAGGFGVVLLDLCETSERALHRIPLSYWYRFRRAVENTPSILLLCSEASQASSCSLNSIEVKRKAFHWTGKAPFLLLRGLKISALLRKPAGMAARAFSIRTLAG